MFKTEDSEDKEEEPFYYHGVDNQDILNGNIIDDCFEDINRNFVTPSQMVSEYGETSNDNEGNLILIGELNVLKV